MSDLALTPTSTELLDGFDLSISSGDLLLDEGLRTAVIVSLFTDRGSWWGDALAAIPGDQIGSDLWQLAREKRSDDVLARARETARRALDWLLEDGVAEAVTVTAEYQDFDRLAMSIAIDRPAGRELIRFADIWAATFDAVALIDRSKTKGSSSSSLPAVGGL